MKLTKAQVYVYKSIDDSGPVTIDPAVTVLVGQNESGKTAFLEALHKAHPVWSRPKFSVTEDYPRKRLNQYKREHDTNPAPVVHLTYEISAVEAAKINGDLEVQIVTTGLTFTREVRYGGSSTIGFSIPEKGYIKHILADVDLPADVKKQAAASATVRQLLKALGEADLNESAQQFRQRLNDMFAKAPDSWSNLLAWYVWQNHIFPRLPRFLYFDDYMLLPGKVNLSRLQQEAEDEPSEESKTVLALLRMAGVDLDEFIKTAAYEEVKARLEGLSNSITDQIFEYWKQNQDLEVEFDIREDPTDDPPFDDGPNLYIRIKNRRHRVTVPFSQRSKGFIWFFSFLVWFDSVKEQVGTKADLVLLLDEPGLSLHGLAQADLLRYIDDLSKEQQVLYTTHSPFMVQPDRLHQVRAVEDKKDEGTRVSDNISSSDRGTVFPLQAALGYDIAQNLFIGKRNLLVEGPADLLYLRYFSAQNEAKGRTSLRDDVVVVPVGGLDKVATFVALLGASRLELAVVHDSTGKPDQRIQQVVREKLIGEKQVVNYGAFADGKRPKAGDHLRAADVEDLISPALYLKLLNGAYSKELGGREITVADLPDGDRIVDRINRYLATGRTQLRPSGGFNHYRVANHLVEKKVRADAATLKRFEALFETVNGLYSDS